MRGGARPGAGRPRGSRNKPKQRPLHTPSERVSILAALGVPHSRIALGLDISVDELCERYSDELLSGAARINEELLEVVHKKAMDGHLWAIKLLLRERNKP